MKKFAFVLCSFLAFSVNAQAEVYHGIDIDYIYEHSDWSSKDKIKEIIDDYTLLLQYRKKLSLCSQTTEKLLCLDKLAKNIIEHFYLGNISNNIDNYQNYVKSTSTVYGLIYCLNKYRVPSGTICNQENEANTAEIVEIFISNQLAYIEKILSNYSFIKDYKD